MNLVSAPQQQLPGQMQHMPGQMPGQMQQMPGQMQQMPGQMQQMPCQMPSQMQQMQMMHPQQMQHIMPQQMTVHQQHVQQMHQHQHMDPSLAQLWSGNKGGGTVVKKLMNDDLQIASNCTWLFQIPVKRQQQAIECCHYPFDCISTGTWPMQSLMRLLWLLAGVQPNMLVNLLGDTFVTVRLIGNGIGHAK